MNQFVMERKLAHVFNVFYVIVILIMGALVGIKSSSAFSPLCLYSKLYVLI